MHSTMTRPPTSPFRLPWPAPALLAWAGAWAVYRLAGVAGWPMAGAALAATLLGAFAALLVERPLRRLLVAGGFPLSAAALLSGTGLPAWMWLVPVGVGLLAYPMRAWRDAPFFPTAIGALDPLAEVVHLKAGARVLDAGCGLGDGLIALRRAWPRAFFSGIEWSLPLKLLCSLRCSWAQVQRGDMWSLSWQGFQVVYLFQRPESMARAVAKARREMAPGSWLVSLEFEAPELAPHARLQQPGQRPVWVYRVSPLAAARPAMAAQLKRFSADNTEALPGR
jgi:hypothetical protein